MIEAGAAGNSPRRRIFVVTAPGVEPVAALELRGLGIEAIPTPGGLVVDAASRELYAMNLHLRTASRILLRIAEFRARTFFELERHAARVPWREFIGEGRAVRLRVTSRKSRLYHQRAIEQRLVAAIGAPLAGGSAGDEEVADTEQLFIVRFLHDRCVISADSSGALLHRRGYRQALARAPMRETLAAAMLISLGWDGSAPLVDPLCGSGTIPIEAALIARRIAPGLLRAKAGARGYAFGWWPGFDSTVFAELLARARDDVLRHSSVRIVASDRDEGAIAATEANAERAGVAAQIQASVRAVSAVEEVAPGGWLITNPPYGARLGEGSRLRDLYAALGRAATRVVPGGRIGLLSADRGLDAQIGIPLREVLSTRNGGIPVRVVAGRVLPP